MIKNQSYFLLGFLRVILPVSMTVIFFSVIFFMKFRFSSIMVKKLYFGK